MFFLRRPFARVFYPDVLPLASKTEVSFRAADLLTKLNLRPPEPPAFNDQLKFGYINSPHILSIEWSKTGGWSKPTIEPFQNFNVHPFNSTLHYAIQCFEGLKAYRSAGGQLLLFRPKHNMFRLKKSSEFICLPDFDGNELLSCIEKFVKIQQKYVPDKPGFSLYIRPTFISQDNTLGVKPPTQAKLFVVASPVGPYFSKGFVPASLFCEEQAIRCAPGGSGEFKIGGNYGPTMRLMGKLAGYGCDQIIWTYDGKVCEVGASNIFFVHKKDGKSRIITPPLNTMILPGVTRQSVIELARENGIEVSEEEIELDRLLAMVDSGEVSESFIAGTAVVINTVKSLVRDKGGVKVHTLKEWEHSPMAHKLHEQLVKIQQGVIAHRFSHPIA